MSTSIFIWIMSPIIGYLTKERLEGEQEKRMEVRPRHLEGMKKLSEHIISAGGMSGFGLKMSKQSFSI